MPAALPIDVFFSNSVIYLSAAYYSVRNDVLSEGIYPVYLQFCPGQQQK